MRYVGTILLVLIALGGIHAHEGCLDEPCLQCFGGNQAVVTAASSLVDLPRVAGQAASPAPAAPTTARNRRDAARAPPVTG